MSTRDPFEPIPIWLQLLGRPIYSIARFVYITFTTLRSKHRPLSPPIRIVCISDTHSKTTSIPIGDLLIHAGDLTDAGTPQDIQAQIDWLDTLPFRHIVCISGNHDTWLDPRSRAHLPSESIGPGKLDWKRVTYLQHSSKTLSFPLHNNRQLKVYGAPQIPACGGPEHAFQYPRGQDAWSDTVSADTDVLVTHTPPKYHRDLPSQLGCEHLLKEAWRVRPQLHVCGHVHSDRGQEVMFWDEAQKAYERAATRPAGLVRQFLDMRLYIELFRIAVYGATGLLWAAVWGGSQASTTLVNAALTYRNTGKLGNEPQTILL